MKKFILFYCEFDGSPRKDDVIFDDDDFDSRDSAFLAITKYKRGDGLFDVELEWHPSDFVLDTQERRLYFMAKNGIPEPYNISDIYLNDLLKEIS